MYCAKCGSIVSENKNFCGNCGAPVNPQAAQIPVHQNAVVNEVPDGTDAPVVNKKKKASVGSVITAIVCILIDVISLLFGFVVLCLSALMSFIAPFGMMIGAYYEETYLLAFITVGILVYLFLQFKTVFHIKTPEVCPTSGVHFNFPGP